jgi:hypothetical protein
MNTQSDPSIDLLEQIATALDELVAYQDQAAWETYLPSEQRTVGQLIDHVAWAWEAESAAFQAIADGASGSGWTQDWLDARNAEQAAASATRSRDEIMAHYRAGRDTAVAFIAGLSEEQLQRSGTHMPGEPERTVAGWIEVCLIGHPREHMSGIEEAVSGTGTQ